MTTTIIAAQPGWFVADFVDWDGKPDFHYDPIIAWRVDINGEGTWPCEPITLTGIQCDILKSPDGVFYVAYPDHQERTTQWSICGKDEADALKRAAEKNAELEEKMKDPKVKAQLAEIILGYDPKKQN